MKILALMVSLLLPGVALAQNNVTLYGILDEGLNFTTNQNGSHNYQLSSGAVQGSRWGAKGREDLGGGLAAVFNLENGYDISSGKFGQGGRIFGRQAYVGLDSNYGAVTLGRQYESISDFLTPYVANEIWGGALFVHANDVDNTNGGVRLDNAVKFKSKHIGGLTIGGVYSFGGQSGAFARDSAWSAGINYSGGNFGIGGAYLHVNSPSTAVFSSYANAAPYVNVIYGSYLAAARSEDIYGAGASYSLGELQFIGAYTSTIFHGGESNHDVRFQNFEASSGYFVRPDIFLVASYTFTNVSNHATEEAPHYHQLGLMADYFLSKRSDIYIQLAEQRASSGYQAQFTGLAASTSDTQAVVRLGMRHKF
jgi:predicted porin